MVGEEERVSDDLPSHIPVNILFIDEDTHQLRDSEGWVSLKIFYKINRGMDDDRS